MEKWKYSKIVYKGNIFSIRAGDVEIDNGNIYQRQIVEHSGGVGIVPIIGNSVILIRQFRISINRTILELPAGRLEPEERPEECAIRELEEEIGYTPGKIELLSQYYSSVGFSNEKMYIFLASDLQKGELKLEADENIEIVKIPLDDVNSMLLKNEIYDSKTIIGLREAFIAMS